MKMDEAARRLNLSVSTLKRRLNEQGTTFLEIKSRVRFEMSADLLRSDSQSIEDIAAYLGFSDHSNFCKFFKSCAGMTPFQYKNSYACNKKAV